MKTDEEWMILYREGSEEAFNVLYEKYSSMVFGYISKRLRASEREDFYQKVWHKFHEKRHLYKEQPFAPWFFVLIRNSLIDEYRRLGFKKNNEIPSELVEVLHSVPEESLDDEVSEVLKHASQESQDPIRRYYLDGQSYEELEGELGLSQTTLRQRLSRAMRGIRKAYEK